MTPDLKAPWDKFYNTLSAYLQEEIDFKLECQLELKESDPDSFESPMGEMTLENLLFILEEIEQNCYDGPTTAKEKAEAKKTLNEILTLGITLGIYKEVSEAQVKKFVATGLNIKSSHFPKLNGKRYEFIKHLHR